MEAIYRIYDTIEKRHRDDMFVNTKGLLYEVVSGYELKSVFHQDRYMVERCTGLYDKNKVLIYENDILKTFAILASDMMGDNAFNVVVKWVGGYFIGNGTVNKYQADISEVIGHALRDSHLLSDKNLGKSSN